MISKIFEKVTLIGVITITEDGFPYKMMFIVFHFAFD